MKDLFRFVAAVVLFFTITGVNGLICNQGIFTIQTEVKCKGSCFNEFFDGKQTLGCSHNKNKDGCFGSYSVGATVCFCNTDRCNKPMSHASAHKCNVGHRRSTTSISKMILAWRQNPHKEITCWNGYVEEGKQQMKKITCRGSCGTRDTPKGGKVYGCHGDFPVKGGCLLLGGAMTCYCNKSLCNSPQVESKHILRFILANNTRNA